MAYLIPIIIIAVSIACIACLFMRKARRFAKNEGGGLVYPDFEDVAAKGHEGERSLPWGLLKMLHIGEKEELFLFMEKFFRKLRVHLMRIENWLTSVTNRLHEKTARRRRAKPDQKNDAEVPEPPASFISLNNGNSQFDETYWMRVLKQNRESPYPYKKLGEIYIARGDFREARSLFRYAFKLDPRDLEAQGKLEELKGKRTKGVNGTTSTNMPA